MLSMVVHKQLYNYMSRYNFLFSNQFCFRHGRSTITHAVLDQLSYIYEQLDKNNYVFSLFLDVKKAFDSVDHKISLSKLKHYGIRGTCYNWFKLYLTDRTQYISKGNANSPPLTVTYCNPWDAPGVSLEAPSLPYIHKRYAKFFVCI